MDKTIKKIKNFFARFKTENSNDTNVQICTLQQSQNRSRVRRFEGKGATRYDALNTLHNYCQLQNKEIPQLIPNTTEFYCGTFNVDGQTFYNKVFWLETKDLYLCYVYL